MSDQQNTILLVEDNYASAEAVMRMLDQLGFETHHVESGQAAILYASSLPYLLMLVDIGLPDISGLDVAKAIRSLSDTSKSTIPIIAITNHTDIRAKCVAAGIQGLIKKPASKHQLERMLAYHVTQEDSLNKHHQSLLDTSHHAMCHVETAVRNDLNEKKHVLASAYQARDARTLRRLLHHICGGVCYINAPELMQSLQLFHDAVKNHFQDKAYLERHYLAMMEAIEAFCDEANIDNNALIHHTFLDNHGIH